MRVLFLFLLAFTALAPARAQFANKPVKGTFYITVDDACTIYVNGTKLFAAGIGESRTPETELKTDDRIVIQLRDDGGGRHFMIVFVSSDGQTLVNFRANNFKIVPDIGVTDFTTEQFQKWSKSAKAEKHKPILPIKSHSEFLWGDLSKCTIACIVNVDMFSLPQH